MNIMSKQPLISLTLALALTLTSQLGLAKTNEAPIPPAEYEARIQAAMANAKTLEASIKAGKRAAFLCKYCHGDDGNSVQPNIPNLAGQNPTYLLNQIQKFGDGRRNDEFMSGLIKSLSNEDRVSMAVFYSSMAPNTPASTNKAMIAQGKKRYQAVCVGCHGANASGSKTIARLAGQRETYISEALANYRSSKSLRTDPVMSVVAKKLSEDDITTIAAYLSNLK